MATVLTAVSTTAALQGAESTTDLDTTAYGAAVEWLRDQIPPPPGTGAIRGVWMFEGNTYAFRDNATECRMWKSSSSGWTQVEFGWTIYFDAGTVVFVEDLVLTGGTSGATATIKKVIKQSGSWGSDAAGYLVLADLDGQFQDNEGITDSGTGSATANGIQSKITLLAGGRYEFVNYNFRGHTSTEAMYWADGVNKAHEFDGTTVTPIDTGMTTDTPTYIEAHKYHLFLSFSGGSIQHSSIGNPLVWSAVLGSGEIGLGDECTGFSIEIGDVLSIYVRNDVYFLYGTSSSDWVLKRLHQGSGAIARSIQKIGYTWSFDDRGITNVAATDKYGDFQQSTVSAKIQKIIDEYVTKIQGSLKVRAKNQYRIFFNDTRGLSLTFYNNQVIGIMMFEMFDQFNCFASCEDTNGTEVLLAGGNDGYVYRLDSGTSHDGEAVNAYIRTAYHHYGNPDILKIFRGLTLEFDSESTESLNVNCDFNYGAPDDIPEALVFGSQIYAQGGFWNADDWDEFFWSSPVVSRGRLRINGVGQTMSVLVYSTTTYKDPVILQGCSVEYANRGVRR